ncbi:hypothetical protein HOY80DRAFT_999973 [Tuber brumale]|nr:hypothetical protein HOY80DRAFT_999973 [Tuber brumale]
MPPASGFPIKPLLSQFNKRNHTQNQREDDSDAESPAATTQLVIAALTLLVAIISVFQCQRFHHWVSSFSISSFVKFFNPEQKALRIVTLPNPPPTAAATNEDLRAIPVAEIPIPSQILIHNDHSNTHSVSTHSNDPPYCHNATTREDGRVLQVEEPLGPTRPEPAVRAGVGETSETAHPIITVATFVDSEEQKSDGGGLQNADRQLS